MYTENFYEVVSKSLQVLVAMESLRQSNPPGLIPSVDEIDTWTSKTTDTPVQEYVQSYKRGNVFEAEFLRGGRSELFRTEIGLLRTGP